jgi:hypothetical protein
MLQVTLSAPLGFAPVARNPIRERPNADDRLDRFCGRARDRGRRDRACAA